MNPVPDLSSLATAQTVDQLSDRFEAEWKAGGGPRIEDYLALASPAARAGLLRALLEVEMELLTAAGKSLEADQYRKRFPCDLDTVNGVLSQTARQAAPSAPQPARGRDSLAITMSLKTPGVDTSRGNSRVAASAGPLPAKIGRFEVIGLLGQGAFGSVYRSRDPQLDREVAIKVPREVVLQTPEDKQRFVREARAAATLNHPHVCPVYEVGEEAGRPYIVMALIDGKSLGEVIKSGKPINSRQAASAVRKVALALDEAHKKQIIHRDLKPGNLMINRRGEPIIMDFGLARLNQPGDVQLTTSGMILGTPAYMSPEQARGDGKQLTPATDIYSLGVVLYELLAGRRPFEGTFTEVLADILHVTPAAPSQYRSGIDPRLELICLKAMAKKPEERYPTMAAFAAAIAEALRESTTPPAPPIQSEPTSLPVIQTISTAPRSTHIEREPASARRAIGPGRSLRLPRWPWLVGTGLAGVLLLLGIIFFTKTGTARVEVKIDVDPADPALGFFMDGKNIDGKSLTQPVELKPGPHELIVMKSNAVYRRYAINVTRGKRSADISLAEEAPPVAKIDGGNPAIGPGTTKPNPPANLDRRAAEWALKLGAVLAITHQGQHRRDIRQVAELPVDEFQIGEVFFPIGHGLTDEKQLAQLHGLAQLKGVRLESYVGYSDEVLRILRPIESLLWITGSFQRSTGAGLEAWHDHPNIEGLVLEGAKLDDAALVHLAKIRGLQQVELNSSRITAQGLAHLKGLPRLLMVGTRGVPLDEAACRELAAIKTIQKMHCSGPELTDAGVAHLATLPLLHEFWMFDAINLTDESFKCLAKMPNLASLSFTKTGCRGEGLAALGANPKISTLDLGGTQFSAAGASELASLRHLKILGLHQSNLANGDLIHLSKLEQLQALGVQQTRVTLESLNQLHKSIPACAIHHDGGTIQPGSGN